MGRDNIEKTLDCGCINVDWCDDWCKQGNYIKHYCNQCKTNEENKAQELQAGLIELINDYTKEPSNILVEKIINTRKLLIRGDFRRSISEYHIEKVLCPSCNISIQYNNIKNHCNSINHIKKLPERDIEKENDKKNIKTNYYGRIYIRSKNI